MWRPLAAQGWGSPAGGLRHSQGQGVAIAGLIGHMLLQEVEKSHPDLLQLPRDLEQPAQAAG